MNSLRAMKRSLSILGFGVYNSASVGFGVSCLGKLRPNRMPEHPMRGMTVELKVPSELRASLKRESFMGHVAGSP